MNANTKGANSTIVLDEGLETFNLVFKGREGAVEISFNPSDTDLIIRLEKSAANIEKALADIPEKADAETLAKANEIIYEQVDYIFGNKISDKVFKNCSPIALNAKGELFIERFMKAVTPYIKDRIVAAREASAARIAKHTSKYTK